MGATVSVLRRELGAYFNTPIGYVIITFFLLLTCWFYTGELFLRGSAEMRPYFGLMPLFMLIFVPAIAMRLWAEERKLGTLEVLMTMPVKTWQVVLGKYLAGLIFIMVMLGLSMHLPITLKVLGNPDPGQVVCGYVGAMVLGMVYLSIGAFASSLTGDQIVAFILGISISFVFFLMGQQDVLTWIKDWSPAVAGVVERLGIGYHFESITRGVLDTRDLIYAVTVTALFLFLNVLVIERRR
ncbi:MAG: ABC transporter permease subunit [Planctomycetota bacterium]|nr:ABC transporter permease subunit [Planctomycetota bacterium]